MNGSTCSEVERVLLAAGLPVRGHPLPDGTAPSASARFYTDLMGAGAAACVVGFTDNRDAPAHDRLLREQALPALRAAGFRVRFLHGRCFNAGAWCDFGGSLRVYERSGGRS